MGLFTKKDPCAICGGKVKGLLPSKIEGQLICKECYGKVDLPDDVRMNLTLEEFKAYRMFREENAQLKAQFQMTQKVDFGAFEYKLAFDMGNGLFCMNDSLESTIFEAKCIKSFVIREDGAPLFEGSAAGLVCYTSTVPDRVAAMGPEIQQVRFVKEMQRREDRRAREENRTPDRVPHYYYDVEEPFRDFLVEIQCEHPYWKTLKTEKAGPKFNNDYPSVQEYQREYQQGVEIMGQLARALMELAFPGAPEQRVGSTTAPVAGQPAAASTMAVDAVAEIQRFKSLMDQGIITEEEFTAKKRQLLGI